MSKLAPGFMHSKKERAVTSPARHCADLMSFAPAKQRGVTFVELIAVIAILAVSLAGVTASISSALSRSSDVVLETRALALAQSYLDEILSRRFDERSAPRGIPPCRGSGPAAPACSTAFGAVDAGESARAEFDDVDDYHGLTEGGGTPNLLRDAEGDERVGYENFSISVSVRYLQRAATQPEENLIDPLTYPTDLDDPDDAKLITVTVFHTTNTEGWQFSAYKANF
ncbi:prepilin-type N-terminal cleavage/methylation domain-containing protein [Gammaproteobacteria bacterium LSUCC0112]|nr:prepilin-type N-terminal cleavage/methylation domain-containing protein [Gammaproteobacteria bacterium LSUCC0112]